jgi:ATP-binding cassette subfamily B (MDR/TAP) protein 1
VFLVIIIIILGSVGLGKFASEAGDKVEAAAAAAKIRKTLLLESNINGTDDTHGVVPETIHGKVEIRAASFAYPQRPEHNVYDNLNLTIEAGQTVAFVGPSGCGKSTAVQLFERFYDPNSGSILIDGVDMKELRVSWLRQQIGTLNPYPLNPYPLNPYPLNSHPPNP